MTILKRDRLFEKNNVLKAKSLSLYRSVLSRLLVIHSAQHEFLRPLAASLRSKDYKGLIEHADFLSKQKYLDATQHFVANQFALLVKKYPFSESLTGLNPEGTAIDTFLRTERRVKKVNRKFDFLNSFRFRDDKRVAADRARFVIRKILGDAVSYERCLHKADFGSGASIGVHGEATNLVRKLSCENWSVTPSALHASFKALMMNHHYSETLLQSKEEDGQIMYCHDREIAFSNYLSRVEVCEYNKISFVPKTAKTHRGIAVEPLLNGFIQKGIDEEMRKRLLRFGIDLSDQSINQRMAHHGSLNWLDNDDFVTIDLKSASDSISTSLCRYLLPEEWFDILNRSRSKYYSLNGDVSPYEKFCSMGNGFCFPLETLLFVSAVCACDMDAVAGVDFHVFGDDIVVRKSIAQDVVALLGHWGFQTNEDKTFLEGPFRESCGGDYFAGQDVRPFTLDYPLDSLSNLFKFLNLSRRSEKCSSFFQPIRDLIVKMIPEEWRFYRPLPGEDDSAITTTGDEHLSSPFCTYQPSGGGNGRWIWYELTTSPKTDYSGIGDSRNEPWLVSAALRGSPAVPFGVLKGLPLVTLRRKTQTKVTRKSYSATSNWLPTVRYS